jgi:hypothetical protein
MRLLHDRQAHTPMEMLDPCERKVLRGFVNRRVAYVSRKDAKAVESLWELPSMKSCQPIDGSSLEAE